MLWDTQNANLTKVSISIQDLYKHDEVTLDLFETAQPKKQQDDALSKTMDTINKRYGASTVSVGSRPKTNAGHVGTKIAFTRIPEKAEFNE